MKKNKIITAMLAGVLAFSSLCGCGGSNADKIRIGIARFGYGSALCRGNAPRR
ncbi:MAG: hypothetical protein ACLUSP_05925 [Christensenellales bacterium]